MGTIVHIAETAFISVLVSAIEAFPSKYQGQRKPQYSYPEGEVYGLLFGQRISKNSSKVYHVGIATPMQIVSERTDSKVAPSPRHYERIKAVIEAYPMYQFLGAFHSHPYPKSVYAKIASSNFSQDDELTALFNAQLLGDEVIEVILGITCLSKSVKAAQATYRYRIENYCGNYKYSLAAYVTNTGDKKLYQVDNLICPFALGIGNYHLNTC